MKQNVCQMVIDVQKIQMPVGKIYAVIWLKHIT